MQYFDTKGKSQALILATLLLCFPLINFNSAYAQTTVELPASFSSEAFWYDGKWPHERSDLAKDPKVTFGRLSNGMRYAILPHSQPPNRVSLYLNVQVGSLMEKEHEQGFAHFVEHMAFNGSKNYPAGSLIPFFQDNGMSFGGDTNAHTSLHETVYKLNLAKNDRSSIQSGLSILRDFADGLLFEEAEVNDEIGVILAEKKARDSEPARNRELRQAFMYPNTVFTQSIIGSEDHIKSATKENLTAFYNKWYTADRMMLVAVGSVNVKQLEAMIQNTFRSVAKPAKTEIVQPWGDPKDQGERFRAEKRPIDGVEIMLNMHFPRIHEHDSKAKQQELLIASFINYAIDRRFSRIAEENTGLWTFAKAINRYNSGFLPSAFFMSTTNSKNWEQVVEIFAQEKKRLQLYGLTQEELTNAKEYYRNQINRYAEEFSGMNNSDVAGLFVYTANMDRVYTSLDYDKKLFEELAKKINLEAVNKVASEVYANDNLTLIISSSKPPSERKIKNVWEEAINSPVNPYIFQEIGQFPYLELPKTLTLNSLPKLEKKEIGKVDKKAINLYSAPISKNVEFYALPLSFAKEGVTVQLIYGNGYASMNAKETILAKFSTMVMRSSGLGNLSLADTKKIGEDIGGTAKENFGLSHFEISVTGDEDKLLPLVQSIWTQYYDPKPTEQALASVKLALENQEHAKNNTLQGIVQEKGTNYFYGNLNRYNSVSYKEVSKIKLAQVEDFIKNSRMNGNIKIFISGDFNVNNAYQLVASYFSDIDLEENLVLNEKKKMQFPTKNAKLKVKESVDQATFFGAWYAPIDYTDRKAMAKRQLATAVLRDKLRVDVREVMGASYSPSIIYRAPIDENDFAILQLMIDTDAENLARIEEYAKELKPFEVSSETLNRLRLPLLTSLESSKKNNAMWHRLVRSEIIYGMPFVEWQNSYANLLKSITSEEVTATIAELLTSPYAQWQIETITD